MKRTMTTKMAAVGSLAVLALAGAACEASDSGATSPGQEVPAEGGITDPGVGGDTGTDTGGMGTSEDAGATG